MTLDEDTGYQPVEMVETAKIKGVRGPWATDIVVAPENDPGLEVGALWMLHGVEDGLLRPMFRRRVRVIEKKVLPNGVLYRFEAAPLSVSAT